MTQLDLGIFIRVREMRVEVGQPSQVTRGEVNTSRRGP